MPSQPAVRRRWSSGLKAAVRTSPVARVDQPPVRRPEEALQKTISS